MPATDPDDFSAAELDLGAGLPPASGEFLKRHGLRPEPATTAPRGGRPRWDYSALIRYTIVGAFYSVSPSMVLAARLGNAVVDEYEAIRGRLPSKLQDFRPIWKHLSAEDSANAGDALDLAIHRRLRQHPDIYLPGTAWDNDFRLFVIDQKYVFSGSTKNIPIMSPITGTSRPVSPEFVISGWQRGSSDEMKVEPFWTTLPDDFLGTPEKRTKAEALEAEAFAAWPNARSLAVINVSLSIRQALDRIYDHRHGLDEQP